jgi:hypothetical protein
VKGLEVERDAALKDSKSWQSEFNMWRNAWLREIGGVIRNKHHEIDGFVLRTRDIYEKACKFDKLSAPKVPFADVPEPPLPAQPAITAEADALYSAPPNRTRTEFVNNPADAPKPAEPEKP